MTAPLSSAGSINVAGDYYLANDITVPSGVAFTVNASGVRVNLNGFTVRCMETGNNYSAAFKGLAANNLAVYGGQITGFRVGVDSDTPWTRVQEIDFSGCKYIGANLAGNTSRFVYCTMNGIGGVSDEAYAIGVNVAGSDSVVDGNDFRNLYRQSGAASSLVGEGCAVVVNASATGVLVQKNFIENDEARSHTIGIFAGIGGGHRIERNDTRNFNIGIQGSVSGGPITVYRNRLWMPQPFTGSQAILAGFGEATENLIVGYDTPVAGGIPASSNTVF